MIRDMIEYFKKDKLTTLIFVIVLGALLYNSARSTDKATEPANTAPSEAVEQFRGVEDRLKEKIKAAGSIDAYLEGKPETLFAVNLFLLITFLTFGTGIIINITWAFNQRARERIIRPHPPHAADWRFSMLFKVAVLFIFGSFVLSVVSGLLENLAIGRMSSNAYLLLHTTLVDFMCFGLIVWVVTQANGKIEDIGLRTPEEGALRETGIAWAAYLALLPIFVSTLIVLIVIAQLFQIQPPAHPLVDVFLEEDKKSTWLVGYSIFLAIVVGPILEEIFFRGFCYPILKKKFGMITGMVLTSLFFALIHQNMFAFVPIFILGMGLAYVYEIRGTLVTPMIMHVTHNLTFITYFFIAKKLILQEAG